MDVVCDSTDADCRTPEVICSGGEIRMEIRPDRWIGEIVFPVLGRENKVQKNMRERLWHISVQKIIV